MREIKKQKKKFGVFDFCKIKETQEEIISFVNKNNFLVLYLGKDCPVMYELFYKRCGDYSAMLIAIDELGMNNFKDTFHRSSSYVDQKTIPPKLFKHMFEDDQVIEFFDGIITQRSQIKGILKIYLRSKKIENRLQKVKLRSKKAQIRSKKAYLQATKVKIQ